MLAPTKPVKSCECGNPCGGCCGCTKESIGLGNVDNTSDLNKPLSRDMITALSGKVDLDIFTQLKNRVLALENTITEIPDLKVRIEQCELDIIDHYEAIKRLQSTTKSMADTITELGNRVTGVNDDLVTVSTRVDALEAKDSNNVKLSGVNAQTIQGTLKANDPVSGATDKTLVTANWVSQTGINKPNNLLHGSGHEDISGIKTVVFGGRIEDLSSHVKNTSGKKDFCPIYKMDGAELHIVLITLIRGGMAGIIKIDTSETSITKTIMLGTMDRRLGVFTDSTGNRFLCCELLFNECISTLGMLGESRSGFLGQVYAIVTDKSLGSIDLTQVAVTE